MKLQLILAGTYDACQDTQQVWQTVCKENNLMLESFDIENSDGQQLAEVLEIKSFPALIVDDKVRAVGHPDLDKARSFIQNLLD